MLVLTRRAGESIMVNDQIEVKVLRIKGKQVHIGIDAPSSTMVHRKEVWARINGITLAPVEVNGDDAADAEPRSSGTRALDDEAHAGT